MKNIIHDFDVVIIGSGFGGSVSAMRLSQKGYKVAVLEMGKEYKNKDFPKTNWNLRKYLWAPLIRCFGIQKLTFLNNLFVIHGIGVGGGSLVYANTLMTPPDHVFSGKYWPKGVDWKKELEPFYRLAEKMLGVTKNKFFYDGEESIRLLGKRLNVEETFHATDVGVFFGEEGKKVSDPYFCGEGPDRVGCNACGACMIGCPNGAKNTLDKNYLYFAKKWGAKVFPETKVTKIIPSDEGYIVETESSTSLLKKRSFSFKASKIILSAGVLGTLELLFKNRNIYKTLPNISETLGNIVRSNNESLTGVTSWKKNLQMDKGIAIGSAIHPNDHTKIEGVRFSKGSTFMRLMALPLTGPGNYITRPIKCIISSIRLMPKIIRSLFAGDWAERSVILLVMQSIDTKMRLKLGRSIFSFFRLGIKGVLGKENRPPSYMTIAQKATTELADEIKGFPQNALSEVLGQAPATAHILGGAVMGNGPDDSVIDKNHEVFNYPGLYICDGSVIPENLAVNPSLTITALSERFCDHFPVNPDCQPDFNPPKIKFS